MDTTKPDREIGPAALLGVGALAFAVGLAVLRDRSLSALPGIALQLAALLVAGAVGWVIA